LIFRSEFVEYLLNTSYNNLTLTLFESFNFAGWQKAT